MDQSSMDRLARLVSRSIDRRRGLLAAISGIVFAGSAAVDVDAAGKSRRRNEKLPCRNVGSQCTTGDQCCSGKCVAKETIAGTTFRCGGKRKKDGKKAGGGGKTNPGAIPTGDPCGAQDVCADPAASCVAYTGGSGGPSGTYCLLPILNDTCTAALQCTCNSCYNGTCLSRTCNRFDEIDCESPMVCASGCPYSTIQAAVDAAVSNTDSSKITIGPGTYREDVSTTHKVVFLIGCPTSTEKVILTNATYGSYAFTVTDADCCNVGVSDIVIAGYSDVEAGPSGYGGGIRVEANSLCLGMRTEIYGGWHEKGGAVWFGPSSIPPSPYPRTHRNLVIYDAVKIHGNQASSHGGGVFLDEYTRLDIGGDASIYENSAVQNGGGVSGVLGAEVEMSGNAEIRNNTAPRGAGIFFDKPAEITLADDATIKENTAVNEGGGIFFNEDASTLTMSGTSSITGNSASGGGGVWVNAANPLTGTGYTSSGIVGNTPDQCQDTSGACSF